MLMTMLFLPSVTAKENRHFFLYFVLVSLRILFVGREKTHLIYKAKNLLLV